MPAQTSPKNKVTIVGVGRLGTALAIALERAGYRVDALISRRLQSAKKAAKLLDGPTKALAVKSPQPDNLNNLLIIAIPDDQIQLVAESLAGAQGAKTKRIALHTSGALSSSVLSPLKNSGWHTGSLHPLVSISDSRLGAQAFQNAYWAVEGDRTASRAGRQIVTDLNGHAFTIGPEQKALYHAAAVMTSGNLVALFDIALEMLSSCGLSHSEARKVLLPLIDTSIDNLHHSDPANALTGTFARADEATVELHLQAVKKTKSEIAEKLYRLLGQRSVELARKRGVDSDALARISRKLRENR